MNKPWQVWLEWTLLLAGLALTALGPAGALPGLLVLAASFGVHARRMGRRLPDNELTAPWFLFLISAAFAAWISFSGAPAGLQFSRLLAAFVVFCALVGADARTLRIASWALLSAASFGAIFWTLTHNFSADPGKFSIITRFGEAINAVFAAAPRLPISGNVAGGALAMSVPVGAGLALLAWRENRRAQALAAGLLTALIVAGLILTSSRGAMLGLAAAGGLALLAWLQVRWLPEIPGKALFWAAVALGAAATVAGLAATGNLERVVGSVPDPTGSLQSRVQIWRQGLTLIGDYPFTGAGLSTFPITFSIYNLLIHVPYHEHMHNIFLETWFEQGVLGVIAMLWGMGVLLAWAWRALKPVSYDESTPQRARRILGWAGLASLLAMGAHGMLDVVFYLKATMPLVGLAAALAAGLSSQAPAGERQRITASQRRIWLAGALGAIVAALVFARPLAAAGYANLGALLQTRQEMSLYNPNQFDNPTLDTIRRELNLDPALRAWQSAVNLQPGNRTALQRLAQVALSRGEYAQALAYMQSARDAGHDDQVTRLLYADALAANGAPEAGAELLGDIPWAVGRLFFQGWYRYWPAGEYAQAANVYKAILVLEPGNGEAQHWLEQAQKELD